MTFPFEKIGPILRNKRQSMGQRIEDMVDENISRSTISNAERGLPNVTESMYIYYAKKLGMGNSLFGIIAEKEQLELEANEEMKEIENVIAVEPDESLQKLEKIREKYQITKKDRLYPFYSYLLGRCAYENKKWKKAKAYFHEALTLFNQNKESNITNLHAACFNELGRVAFFENQLEDALQYTLDGLKVFHLDGERPRFQFHFLLNKSIYLKRLQQPEKALEAIESLHSAIENLPSTKVVLSIVHLDTIVQMYNMYAVILTELQLYEKALDYAHQGLEIVQNNNLTDQILTLHTTLGSVYFKLGNLPKAEKCFKLALNLRKSIKNEYPLVTAYIQLGRLYIQQKNWKRAEQALKEAISISERNHNIIDLIDCFISLGDCWLQQEKFDKAITPYKNAENLIKTSKNNEKRCEIAINLGLCYQKLGNQSLFERYRNKVFQVKTEMKWGNLG
ncbi:helix-turn-helix domain-containing protein [Shimazuella alba]|uniref:Tetratricopeptide repeat protein n=1 Tax=Shimazuella alba TaxID=2690964 RepID=A0A6I4VP62_9BACL|nr:tetratricopeptide repeat protein [Shimazuella alba]MXQ53357.1 tetratricopeptide repeat protein [Shimazuella alba]